MTLGLNESPMCAGAGKQRVRERVPDARDPELVPRVLLAEQINGFEDVPPLLFRLVDPGECGC